MKKPKKYQTHPTKVEAIQFIGEKNKFEICEFMKGVPFHVEMKYGLGGYRDLQGIVITNDDGIYDLKIGDWLIKEGVATFSYLHDEDFKITFIEVQE